MISTRDLVDTLAASRRNPQPVERVLHGLIIMSLAPQAQRFYGHIQRHEDVSTPALARRFRMKQSQAGSITKHLYDLGLVARTWSEGGRDACYLWRVVTQV